jgi:hypothetical protein
MECLKTMEWDCCGNHTLTCPFETDGECYYENNPNELLEVAKNMYLIMHEQQ